MPDLLGFFAHNPMIAHLQRRAATDRLSIGRLLWWVFGGGLLLLVGSVWAVQNSYFRLMDGAWLLAWAVSFGVPMATAGTAALLTVRDIQSGPFDLLYMSQLSDEAIVGGYVALSLYRVRPLIALVMAILPLHVVAAFYTLIETNARTNGLASTERWFVYWSYGFPSSGGQ